MLQPDYERKFIHAQTLVAAAPSFSEQFVMIWLSRPQLEISEWLQARDPPGRAS